MFVKIFDPHHLFIAQPDQRIVLRGAMFVYVII